MTLSTVAASASAPSCRPPRLPPRTLLPSRVPSATSTVTCLAQPSPSSQVFLTRSAIARGPLAGRAEHGAQLIVDRVGKHRAERLVRPRELGHLRLQPGQVGLGGAVDGTEVQLGTQVDQQLVAPRRRTVGDGLDGVQRLDLVDPHLGRQRDQRERGIGGVERDVVRTGATRRRGGSRGRGCRFGRRRVGGCLGRRRFVFFRLRLGVGVGGEQHGGVTLGVEHFHCAVGVFGQLQRVGGQARDGRRGLHADLDEPLDTESARGFLDEQQVLGLDPAHRAGELPGQQLDHDLAAQLAPASRSARCRSRRGSRRAARRAPDRGSPG